MDIAAITTTNISPATIITSNPKSPEADVEAPRIQSSKPLSFTNGVLKRHHHYQNHHAKPNSNLITKPIVVAYKECLKNHAASLGGHALDGCGEFMSSPSSTPTDPTSLKCAACGCHRNFHRRDPDDPQQPLTPTATQVIEYQPHHRHHPLPPPRGHSPSPPSPPPISSSFYPSSAPHMLLALSAGVQGAPPHPPPQENSQSMGLFATPIASNSAITTQNGRKRFRTKFSQGQKEKMLEFADRVGWKIQKSDEEVVSDFCNEIGVDRSVLKVWMHNNKNKSAADHHINGGRINTNINSTLINNNPNHNFIHSNKHDDDDDTNPHLATNGSSSSS